MEKKKKENMRENYKKFSLVFKLVLLAVLLIGVPLYIFFFHHDLLDWASSIDNVENWLYKYEKQSFLVYFGAQIFQIIICIIPGQALQLAAGYLYGFWIGYILSIAGAAAGSVLVYYLSRFLGHDALHILFGERKVTEVIDHMNSKRGLIITFIIFLIPGIPKDLCCYAAGLSEVKLQPYLIVSLLGRTPGMMGSLIIGRQLMAGGYTSAAVIAGIAVVLFILGVIFHKKFISFIDRACEKLLNM